MSGWIGEVEARGEIKLYYRGRLLLDEAGARLLEYIDRYGSILMAARALGMPYSRAWERISHMERVLGVGVVERRRGGRRGGGTSLTEAGRALLEKYKHAAREFWLRQPYTRPSPGRVLLVAGSHDILLELIVGSLRRRGENVETAWIGSGGGLAALMLGEADAAPMHLYDEESGEYNIPFLRRYWLTNRVALLVGYERELVVAYRENIGARTPEEAFRILAEGRLRLVNRNAGSGTRQVIDAILDKVGVDDRTAIPGYTYEVNTHLEAARAVAGGEADIGVMLRRAAEFYGLHWMHLKWERYDIALLRDSLEAGRLDKLVESLQRDAVKRLVEKHPGYRVVEETGTLIHI